MFNGKILFYQDIQQFIQIGARENVKWATDLAAAWRKRLRLLDPAKPDEDEGHS
jgi:hypothetical protein